MSLAWGARTIRAGARPDQCANWCEVGNPASIACSSSSSGDDSSAGASGTGTAGHAGASEAAGAGGKSTTGGSAGTGGASGGKGGASAGGASTGGTNAGGAGAGGASTGGTSAGGTSTGGAPAGGANNAGTGGASTGGTSAGGDLANCYQMAKGTCISQMANGAKATLDSLCTNNGGATPDTCPTASLVGCCTIPGSGQEQCFYTQASSPLTEMQCKQIGGTWSAMP